MKKNLFLKKILISFMSVATLIYNIPNVHAGKRSMKDKIFDELSRIEKLRPDLSLQIKDFINKCYSQKLKRGQNSRKGKFLKEISPKNMTEEAIVKAIDLDDVSLLNGIPQESLVSAKINCTIDLLEKEKIDLSPLQYSILTNKTQCFKFLILNGSDSKKMIFFKKLELQLDTVSLTVLIGNLEMIEFLKQEGINLHQDKFVWCAACLTYRSDFLEWLLKDCIQNNSDLDNCLGYGLIGAVLANNFNAVEQLLLYGANPNFTGANNIPPILFVSNIKNEKMAELLIENGADVNMKDKYGQTPIISAIRKNNFYLAQLLINSGANNYDNLMFYATKNNNLKIAKFLVNNGVNINVRDRWGFMPIHDATKNNSIDVVKFLISNGADVNSKVKLNNFKSLNLKTISEGLKFVNLLMYSGSQKTIDNHSFIYATPLSISLAGNQIDMMKILISNGAKVNGMVNVDGQTLLHMAVINNKFEISDLLVKAGIDINKLDANGQSALDLATDSKIKELLEKQKTEK